MYYSLEIMIRLMNNPVVHLYHMHVRDASLTIYILPFSPSYTPALVCMSQNIHMLNLFFCLYNNSDPLLHMNRKYCMQGHAHVSFLEN